MVVGRVHRSAPEAGGEGFAYWMRASTFGQLMTWPRVGPGSSPGTSPI